MKVIKYKTLDQVERAFLPKFHKKKQDDELRKDPEKWGKKIAHEIIDALMERDKALRDACQAVNKLGKRRRRQQGD